MTNSVSQEQAQFLIDWTNQNTPIFGSIVGNVCETEYEKAFRKADKLRLALWAKTFNAKTRWKAVQTGNKNQKLKLTYIHESKPY
jgi:hypothetical protein